TEDESKASADRRRAVQLLRGLAKGNSANGGNSEAENLLYDLEHLQVGMKAPEVTGTDPNGKTIKLSQLRGKVVVLYFWGFW
ncbi:MAG TPA: redoxin domain-containing protein, partial [Phycisphaerae bacterium]